MTIRTKTIEYVFPQSTATQTSATRLDFAALTVYIPENTTGGGVTFRSVAIEASCCDTVTSATNLTAILIGIKLGATAFDDLTVTETFTSSATTSNNYFFTRLSGLVSYFQTNFGAGTNQTCQVGVKFTGPATNNHTAKLIITYDYDISSATQIKTVKIPIESPKTSAGTIRLTTTLTEIGTNQVPQLTGGGGLLPENSIQFRDLWFEIATTEAEDSSTTDFQLGLQLDSETEVTDGSHEAQINRNNLYRRIWKRINNTSTTTDFPGSGTAATHAFKARSVGITGRFASLNARLCATYEYTESATTSVLNSIEIPLSNNLLPFYDGSSTSDPARTQVQFQIQEPGTITLQQSAVEAWGCIGHANSVAFNFAAGSQSFTSYTPGGSATVGLTGTSNISHRIDTGGNAGSAGVTLARGNNTFTFLSSIGSTFTVCEHTYTLLLNYTSSKATAGTGAHNHTVYWGIQGLYTADTSSNAVDVTFAPVFQESSYWLTAVGLRECYIATGITGPQKWYFVRRTSSESTGDWWQAVATPANFGNGLSTVSGAQNVEMIFSYLSDSFGKYPNDPTANKIVLSTSRSWRYHLISVNHSTGDHLLVTYHAITKTIAGTVSNYNGGDGSGLTVGIYNASTRVLLGTATTTAGGAFTFTWYDDTVDSFAEEYQDSTHFGRSKNGPAV